MKGHGQGRALLKDLLCFPDDGKKNSLDLHLAHQCLRNCSPVKLYRLPEVTLKPMSPDSILCCCCLVPSDLKETFFPHGARITKMAPKPSPYTTTCRPLIRNSTQKEENKSHMRCTDAQPYTWARKHQRNPLRLWEDGESQSRQSMIKVYKCPPSTYNDIQG